MLPANVKTEANKGPIKLPKQSLSVESLTLDLRKSELNKSSALNSCVRKVNDNNKLKLLRGGIQ